MIERLLYTLLSEGFAAIQADPTILEDIFNEEGFALSAVEVAGILTYFAANAPTVSQGYPRSDHSFPLVSIILGNESSGDNWIGDFAGQIDIEESVDFGADCYAQGWDATFPIHCYSEHPDITRYLYEIVKTILQINAETFADAGVYDIKVSGLDLMPDARYIPEHLFVRQYTFSAKHIVQRVDKDSKLNKAFTVTGIHVGDPNNPTTDVDTNVTVGE